jgi:hypothetical protein
MRSIVEEYSERPEQFLKHFGTSLEGLQNKYEKLSALLHGRLDGGILKEFDHVHALFKNFLTKAIAHHEKNT